MEKGIDTSKPITLADATKQWQAGRLVFVVEYRHSTAENINWRDKQSGKAMTAGILRHTVETENSVIIVSERTGQDFNPATYVSPLKKGQKVALWLSSLATERGVTQANGVLQPIA